MLHRIVVLGDGGAGKTALTIQFCLNHFVDSYDPTIEDSYRKQAVVDGVQCVLELLDTAGQEEYFSLRDQWIREGDGFVVLFSVTQASTFKRITRYVEQIRRVKDSISEPMVLVGNKCDLIHEREVSTEEAEALAKRLGCEYIEASARTSVNVERCFYSVVRLIRSKSESAEVKPVCRCSIL